MVAAAVFGVWMEFKLSLGGRGDSISVGMLIPGTVSSCCHCWKAVNGVVSSGDGAFDTGAE